MNEVRIPISAIAEIQYCPRNFYYRAVEQADDFNHHILEGQFQEDKRKETLQIKTKETKKYRDLYLASDLYNIVGIIDEIEETESGLIPVEYKKGSKKESLRDEIQICCQAMLIEENMNTVVEKGFLYYVESKYKKEVIFNSELRELTLETIELAKSIIEDQIIPEVVNDQRCWECSLVQRCLPQEVNQINNSNTAKEKIRPIPSLNLGRILYVDTMGASLKKSGGLVLVTKDGENLNEIPITSIDQVVLMGPINISTQLLQEFLKRNIPLHLNNSYGKALGWLNPIYNKNSTLRLAQAKVAIDNNLSFQISKAVVVGKLLNQRTLLMRYNRKEKSPEIEKVLVDIKSIVDKIHECIDKNQLRGFEGIASKGYFSVFNHLISETEAEFYFSGRERRPPNDPVNAMLSYGYTLLSSEITNEVIRVGLDPYIGFYHSNVYGRPALALDLMEEFRSIIVDSVVFSCINKKVINKEHFNFNLNICLLNEKGRKEFVKAFRNRMHQEVTHPIFQYKLNYRRIMELQARFLAKVLTGEIGKYESFTVR